MARMIVDGTEFISEKLEKRSRTTIQLVTMAGAKAAENRIKEMTSSRQHVRNSDMMDATTNNGYREWFGGGSTEVYPQGDDRKGVRNATKAYVINYGKGRRPTTKRGTRNRTGDKFITGDEKNIEKAVFEAMQAECDRLTEQLNEE